MGPNMCMSKVGPRPRVVACPALPGALELHEGAAHIFVGSVLVGRKMWACRVLYT